MLPALEQLPTGGPQGRPPPCRPQPGSVPRVCAPDVLAPARSGDGLR